MNEIFSLAYNLVSQWQMLFTTFELGTFEESAHTIEQIVQLSCLEKATFLHLHP